MANPADVQWDANNHIWVPTPAVGSGEIATVGTVLDGGGAALTTSIAVRFMVDYACTIQQVTLLADRVGSVQLDIQTATYAGYPTTSSIVAAAPPAIVTAQKYQDAVLTGWTTTIAAGTTVIVSVTSATTIQQVLCALKIQRS